jgi:hypothetical protein
MTTTTNTTGATMNTDTNKHTHRNKDNVMFHIMQYPDLAICGMYIPSPVAGEPPLGHKCVVCIVESLKGN